MTPRLWPRRDGMVAIGTTVGGITVRVPRQQARVWSQAPEQIRRSFLEDVDERAGLRQVCTECRTPTYDERAISVRWCQECAANTLPGQRPPPRHRGPRDPDVEIVKEP